MNTRKKDITLLLGVLIIVISCLVIGGWIFGIAFFRLLHIGNVPMKLNTAFCFLLLGISLLLLRNTRARTALVTCSAIVALIGLVTIAEYLFNWNAGIDQLLWKFPIAIDGIVYSPRMSIPAAINFVLMGLVIWDNRNNQPHFYSWLLLWVVFLNCFFSFAAYAFRLPYLNNISEYVQMALETTILFMCTSLGIYYAGRYVYMKIPFRKKLAAGFILIAVVLGMIINIYKRNDEYFNSTSRWLQHTNDVLHRSEQAVSTLNSLESDLRAYMLTNNKRFLDSVEAKKSSVFLHVTTLGILTRDNPPQSQRIKILLPLLQERFRQFDRSVALRQQPAFNALEIVTAGTATMESIKNTIAEIQQEENELLAGRKANNLASVENARRIIYFFGIVMVVVLFLLLVLIVRNINARIKAEEQARQLNDTLEKRVDERTQELLKAESKFHYTLDNMMEGAQIIDFNWKYIYVNDALLKYSQFTREELIGQTVMERYPGIETQPIFKIFERCMYERESIHLENHFKFPDGSDGWFELSYQPIPDGIFILSVDITARKRSEESVKKLNESIAAREKRFRSIIESSNDLVSLLDKDLKPIYRSPSAQRITGWSLEEVREQTAQKEHIHPADVEGFRKALAKCMDMPAKPVELSFRTRHKQGHYVWLEGSATNMLQEKSLAAIVINLQDVSLRKRSEEQLIINERTYRLIASSIPGSVISLLDKDWRYYLVEGDMLQKLGYEKQSLLGKTVQEAVPEKRYRELFPYLQRAFNGESLVLDETRPNYDTLARYVPLKDDQGDVYALMIVVFDVSELKNAQRALAKLNHELEDRIIERTSQLASANKELESFSYSVSHDLRAPLRGIDGWSLALLEDYGSLLDEKGHKYLARVRSETQRMGELIDDMLKLSRVSRTEIKLEQVNMSELVNMVADRIREEYPNRQFEFMIQPGLFLNGDANLLEIMLTNLLNNAAKFTGRSSLAKIEFGKTKEEGKDVFFIRDNGVGFNMENAKNLFGAFQRMHRQSEFPGTGIGLATVQRIVNLHHGNIWATATVDNGATFHFTIP